jgi:hypothetical protein
LYHTLHGLYASVEAFAAVVDAIVDVVFAASFAFDLQELDDC